mmetsp:Transcript_7884/g.19870  ORF Transcript_7884/g.19870 Transcript_7884/m.19870 type:complete len:511 (-) Transcript_7884:43-1575(-)|eukprot:CAMPEP_0177648156 /NCGR_PEP_ID=MMETSP0447-20121125/10680_1 /TAXON_ID=0 /ORGANISM="Stygamoeba regulata, Strain BSH-02190019" /LENGTH=510 /DNA_ID=CAMNT_0019150783 /DNA_START=73 /DNA_END=1605 /DNA_ORIENTATION=+
MSRFLLFECAAGYALFQADGVEEITVEAVAESAADFSRFSKLVKQVAFQPFTSGEQALEEINKVSEGALPDLLRNFLEMNIPQMKSDKKKKKLLLGVGDDKLASVIQETAGLPASKSTVIVELLRGVRANLHKYIDQLKEVDLDKAQLALGHAYSRAKVKFNVNRVDNMIIQSICLLDQMDKDLNTFAMRAREWYSWHFPELVKIVPDNIKFAKLAHAIQHKGALSEEHLPELEKITGDAQEAKDILDAARSSMGMDLSDFDMNQINLFTTRVIELADYRTGLFNYLRKKMGACAPNLTALIGELVGARLISHAGSLTNLAKCPASTLQILGAEKALFRALKTRGATPKYGLIFHSSFIGRASAKNKGRISRYLANKCSIASRIDSFSDTPSDVFGKLLKTQVEDRLTFYDTGEPPRKNADVMQEAMSLAGAEGGKKRKADDAGEKKKRKKRQSDAGEAAEEAAPKKKKKSKEAEAESTPKKKGKGEAAAAPSPAADGEKKKKRKKKGAE